MRRTVLVLAAAALTLTACGSGGAGDLSAYLHDQYQYAHDYHSALDGARYTVDSGSVTIKTTMLTGFTDAQDVCNWASDWLYNGHGDGGIKVLNSDGDVLSQRHAVNDVCSMG